MERSCWPAIDQSRPEWRSRRIRTRERELPCAWQKATLSMHSPWQISRQLSTTGGRRVRLSSLRWLWLMAAVVAALGLLLPAESQAQRNGQRGNAQGRGNRGAQQRGGQQQAGRRGQPPAQQPPATDSVFEQWVAAYAQRLPSAPQDCTAEREAQCAEAARAIDMHAAALAEIPEAVSPEGSVSYARRLMQACETVSQLADRTLVLRTQFTSEPDSPERHAQIESFLGITNGVFDLVGRLSFHVEACTYESAYRVASQPALRAKLIAAAAETRNPVGTEVMCWALLDPPPNSPNGALPSDAPTKRQLLDLAANSGHLGALPILAQFVRVPGQAPEMLIAASNAIRKLGLPQDPRPGQSGDDAAPEITAAELQALLSRIDGTRLDDQLKAARQDLIDWLDTRISQGVTADEFPLGGFSVRPGDWLLMRNPSPYNLFTDLSPGLFTHVGIVTTEIGTDGRRRFVIVDLPERGTNIPATNVESFVQRTRHYVFVRPADTAGAATMAEVARQIIGNESVFDLKFRTAGVASLQGKPKAGAKIETYCAGLLLLAAQETDKSRETYFPLTETMAAGRTAENLGSIGLSFGDNFVSPTGALFSSAVEIVGRRAPMYEPGREIEEAIYDHFALSLRTRTLSPQTSMLQNIRTTLAEAATDNPALARMLAELNGVNPNIDMQAAAKTAVVVEALDDAAYGASGDYLQAFYAVMAPTAEVLRQRGVPEEQVQRIETGRSKHQALAQRYAADQVNDRQLREALIDYYVKQGKARIDAMFTNAP